MIPSFKATLLCVNRGVGVLLILSFAAAGKVSAQEKVKKDTSIVLLSDLSVQLNCSQALNDMYDFKFDKAEAQFHKLKAKYRWHPLPYFLMGLIEWWKMFPSLKDHAHDDSFLAYMDSTIMTANNLYDNYQAYKIEASFFLAAAYGFKGRLYADEERHNWPKAIAAGSKALNYLDVGNKDHNLSPEFLFGDALYNYFSVWIPENYTSLKPVLWFFQKGDKELGLKQLREVSYNSFYTRIEAQVWLMRILNSYEKGDQQEAFQIAEYLFETYPNNPVFHRYYARMLYYTGRYTEAEPVAKSILSNIDSAKLGYEGVSGRYASFFLGQIYEARRKFDEAKMYYERCMKFSEQTESTDSGYYLYSIISLGEICQEQGDKQCAKKYFKEAKKKSSRKDEAFKDAKRRLKRMDKAD